MDEGIVPTVQDQRDLQHAKYLLHKYICIVLDSNKIKHQRRQNRRFN